MYKLFYACLVIIWICDILNLPFVEFLDSAIPINGLAWFLIFWFIPGSGNDE